MRVIAGTARGRHLRSPASGRVRPTGDKVKGAIFSLIEALAYQRGFEPDVDRYGHELFAAARAWPRVLDLYAGSGALGIEALSRGAEHADFVESDPQTRRLVAENLRLTGLAGRGTVYGILAGEAVSTLARTYDLILADPPYADADAESLLARLASSPRLADCGIMVWEHRSDLRPPARLGRLELRRTRRHGRASVSLFVEGDDLAGVVGGAGAEQPATIC